MSTFSPVKHFDPSALSGSTLIIPSVSLANLAQLAADLLISSLHLERVGWVGDGSTVVPFVGAADHGPHLVTGGLELYGKPGGAVFVLQQRSPVIKSRKDEHVALLHAFIVDPAHTFGFVLLLASLDAASQDDAQLLTPHQHIVPPSSSSKDTALLPSPLTPSALTRLTSLPPLSLSLDLDSDSSRLGTSPQPSQPDRPSPRSHSYPPFLFSAGLTRRTLSALRPLPTPHGALTAWCVEGDVRADAEALAGTVLRVLGMDDVPLLEPPSWRTLFGGPVGWSGGTSSDAEIYG